jgi:hypothetical protein
MFGPKGPPWFNVIREMSAINDEGRWEWTITGDVQPFEEVSRYEARRVKDRLTPEMLDRYCAALGIRAFDGSFYGNEGYLVENKNSFTEKAGNIRTLTLDEAQKDASVRPAPGLPLSR